MDNATFQAEEMCRLGYRARVTVHGEIAVVLTVEQAIFIQACTASANTREAKKKASE